MKLAPPVENAFFHPPAPGDNVGDHEVVAPLGSGGYGFVYKVVCEGRFFALKLLRARSLDARGQREINILRHLEHRNVVRLHSWGRWPHAVHGHLFFVMDFVEGRTLEEWALQENPCVRCVARVLLEIVRALAAIHARGVLHRDLKLENLLIRTSDGVPILVDFGIGWLAGEPTLTRGALPPGTPEYRSPDALRFEREHASEQARYTPDEGDELWAMGVILYWLLTDVLPFGPRYQRGNGLNERILTERPKAPHEVNPRVPRALGELCLRMLEKQRGARFATCLEVVGALEAALAGADASWDLPLVDPEAPELASTEEEPGKVPRDTEEREAHQWNMKRPRRGQKARREPAPADGAPGVAKGAGHAPEAPPPAVAETTSPVASGQGARGVPPALTPPGLVHRVRSRPLLTVRVPPVGAVALAAGVALMSAWLLASPSAVKGHTAAAPVPAPMEAPLPPGWLATNPTLHAALVREVAAPGEPSEAGEGAVASLSPPPASTFATMLRENDTRQKSEDKSTARQQRRAPRCVPTRQETCVVGFCTVLLTGCTGTPQVVRPPPRPSDCPPGAVKTMKEMGVDIGDTAGISFPPYDEDAGRVTVRESTPVEIGGELGRLSGAELTGRLYLGPERVYGRFTQARAQRSGKTYPVCLELVQRDGETLGVDRKDVGGPADSAVVFSSQAVRAVERFE